MHDFFHFLFFFITKLRTCTIFIDIPFFFINYFAVFVFIDIKFIGMPKMLIDEDAGF